MRNAFSRILPLLALLAGLCSCQSTTPTAADMDRYYKEAQVRAERQIAHYGTMREQGSLSEAEYDEKVRKAREGVSQQAVQLAWTHHDMAEAVKRSLSIPTGDHPVPVEAPGLGGNGTDSFYRAAGSEGQGYQGMGSGMWHGYQAGSTIDTMGTLFSRSN